jgi:hypothetical protein
MNVQSRRQNVTVSFDDIFYLRPRVITVSDGATGAPIHPFNLGNYYMNTATSGHLETVNVERICGGISTSTTSTTTPQTLKSTAPARLNTRSFHSAHFTDRSGRLGLRGRFELPF